MLRVGILGLGFMGMIHYLAYRALPGVRVVAICDPKQRRLDGDWTDIAGNFGPRGMHVDLSGVATFTSYHEMLASSDLDLVDITLPPRLHSEAAIASLRSGRHVFCEKPMALELSECDHMLEAARQARRRLLIGQVLPFFPEYDWALATARSGNYGRVVGGTFRRVIADPHWNAKFWSPTEVGGPLYDLHVHDAHFVRLLLGMPSGVHAQGTVRHGLPEFWNAAFDYPGLPYPVIATCDVTGDQDRPFAHGFKIQLEAATLKFDFEVRQGVGRYTCPPTLQSSSAETTLVDLGSADPLDAFKTELAAMLRAVQTGSDNDILSGQTARDAIEICHRERLALCGATVT